MILRLVVVGMVAALGVTVPTRTDILGWVKAAHTWTAAQFAEWDPCKNNDANGGTLVAIYSSQPIEKTVEATTTAQPARPASDDSGRTHLAAANQRKGPSFEPIIVEECVSVLADELNREADGLNIDVRREIGRLVESATKVPARPVRRLDDLGLALTTDPLEQKLLMRLEGLHASQGTGGESPPTVFPVVERRSSAKIEPISCTFTGPAKAEHRVRQAVPIPPMETGSSSTRMGHGDLIWSLRAAIPGLVVRIDRLGERIDSFGRGATLAVDSGPSFTPIDPAPTSETELADRLNRASEGLTSEPTAASGPELPRQAAAVKPSSTSPSPSRGHGTIRPDPHSDVGIAIRLTGEAVHAWMNVLTSPADVRVSAR